MSKHKQHTKALKQAISTLEELLSDAKAQQYAALGRDLEALFRGIGIDPYKLASWNPNISEAAELRSTIEELCPLLHLYDDL